MLDDVALPLLGEMLGTLRRIETLLRDALIVEEDEPQRTLEGEEIGRDLGLEHGDS